MCFQIHQPTNNLDSKVEKMLPAVGGFPASDRLLFLSGYNELCRIDLNGKRALEICGGFGMLAAGLAEQFPLSQVIGLDLYEAQSPEIERKKNLFPGLSYVSGDAFDLSRFDDESFDLVFGQAALHHLSHDLKGICEEVLRVLKPGGRLVFIFEPVGHNLFVAAVRAVNMARHELGDESNLYISQFKYMREIGFSYCEVQMFNLIGYPMKFLSSRFSWVINAAHTLDSWIFRAFPKLLRYGANCNLVLTK